MEFLTALGTQTLRGHIGNSTLPNRLTHELPLQKNFPLQSKQTKEENKENLL